MKIAVYFCHCGGIVSDKLDAAELTRRFDSLESSPSKGDWSISYKDVELACGDDGQQEIVDHLLATKPDRVVIAACSPREHEETFRGVVQRAGLNPFLMQLVNVRELVTWVTPDAAAATEKTWHLLQAAINRVQKQQPLERERLDVSTDLLVIGGGPAGLKAALTFAEAGRKVTIVEKSGILGGMPLRYEETFPAMECGPCMLEPFIASVLHGPFSSNIEVLLQTEVVGSKGSFGNFIVTMRQAPRYVDLNKCIGCTECIPVCPVSGPNDFNLGLNRKNAMDFVVFGGLPNVPYLDPTLCTRMTTQDNCRACQDACPVPETVRFDDTERLIEKHVGGMVLAVGSSLYDVQHAAQFGASKEDDKVLTSLALERVLASNGANDWLAELGENPKIAFIHCAGSIDPKHVDYCSGICCLEAFKLNRLAAHRLPGAQLTHFVRSIVVPGKEEMQLCRRTIAADDTRVVQYREPGDVTVRSGTSGQRVVSFGGNDTDYDLVVLMTATVPASSNRKLSAVLDVPLDSYGFFAELGRSDATASKVRGIHVAGTCLAPMDISRSMTQGMAAAGSLLAALVPGRQLELEAEHAVVDEARCSGCRSCIAVCPYKAISYKTIDAVATVTPALCVGCGTCVATCPTGAMTALHFTDEQIFAEIEGILQ